MDRYKTKRNEGWSKNIGREWLVVYKGRVVFECKTELEANAMRDFLNSNLSLLTL